MGRSSTTTPGNRCLYNPNNLHDLAPRLGFAYAVMPKLVMRGGYGVYYARNFYGGNGPDPGYSTSTAWTSSPDGIHGDYAFCTGIPIGPCASYRERARRPDERRPDPQRPAP